MTPQVVFWPSHMCYRAYKHPAHKEISVIKPGRILYMVPVRNSHSISAILLLFYIVKLSSVSYIYSLYYKGWSVMVHICDPSLGRSKQGILWVLEQPGIYTESLFQSLLPATKVMQWTAVDKVDCKITERRKGHRGRKEEDEGTEGRQKKGGKMGRRD